MLFFFKQKTAYEMRISDWSSDVCSSDLLGRFSLAGTLGMSIFVTSFSYRQGLPREADLVFDVRFQIGRASCRESVCQYVSISVVAVSLKKKKKTYRINNLKT